MKVFAAAAVSVPAFVSAGVVRGAAALPLAGLGAAPASFAAAALAEGSASGGAEAWLRSHVHEEAAVVEVAAASAESEESAEKPPVLLAGGLPVPDDEWSQSMVRKYISIYTTERGARNLRAVLSRGEEYRVYIRRRLDELGLPRALEYLPVVESEYLTTATSRSGAKGLWQFMENSIRPFLRKNDWLDERLDPWKSTDAALRKLADNQSLFGDWAIALAAYNCGAGLMARTVRSNPGLSYWQLAEGGFLKKQTAHYVPKLLAITELCENPSRYGIELPSPDDDAEVVAYDYVETSRPVSLARLAKALAVDVKTLRRLNPSVVRSVTPPGQGFPIRLPYGMGADCERVIEAVAVETAASAYVEHRIEKGDTLWGLSRAFGCTVTEICDLNGISDRTVLRLGRVLYVPSR